MINEFRVVPSPVAELSVGTGPHSCEDYRVALRATGIVHVCVAQLHGAALQPGGCDRRQTHAAHPVLGLEHALPGR